MAAAAVAVAVDSPVVSALCLLSEKSDESDSATDGSRSDRSGYLGPDWSGCDQDCLDFEPADQRDSDDPSSVDRGCGPDYPDCPGCVRDYPDCVRDYSGCVRDYPDCVRGYSGCVRSCPGCVRDCPGCVRGYPGCVRSHPGCVLGYSGYGRDWPDCESDDRDCYRYCDQDCDQGCDQDCDQGCGRDCGRGCGRGYDSWDREENDSDCNV